MLKGYGDVMKMIDVLLDKMSHAPGDSWALVDNGDGRIHPLQTTSITVGKNSTCDISPKGPNIANQHAVIIYDTTQNQFQLKDLGSDIGTYVNGSRIPADIPVTLNIKDTVKFGRDSTTMYHIQHIMDDSQNEQPAKNSSSNPPTQPNMTSSTVTNVTTNSSIRSQERDTHPSIEGHRQPINNSSTVSQSHIHISATGETSVRNNNSKNITNILSPAPSQSQSSHQYHRTTNTGSIVSKTQETLFGNVSNTDNSSHSSSSSTIISSATSSSSKIQELRNKHLRPRGDQNHQHTVITNQVGKSQQLHQNQSEAVELDNDNVFSSNSSSSNIVVKTSRSDIIVNSGGNEDTLNSSLNTPRGDIVHSVKTVLLRGGDSNTGSGGSSSIIRTRPRSEISRRARPRSEVIEHRCGLSEKEDETVVPVWAARKHTHVMAECPGCIAEQEIHHTCGGNEDSPAHTNSNIIHNHPIHTPSTPRSGPQHRGSWEEPPIHYHTHQQRGIHHPQYPAPPPVDYRNYPPTSSVPASHSVNNFQQQEEEDYLYSPPPQQSPYASQPLSLPPASGVGGGGGALTSPRQYGGGNPHDGGGGSGGRRLPKISHEAVESQMKRSKSAQFPSNVNSPPSSSGFVPYSRDHQYNYSNYPYSPPSSGYPPPQAHHPTFHPPVQHLHGGAYYPPPPHHHPPPPPPMYSRYPAPHKSMYPGCKTCSSLMAEFGQVPPEHLMYHQQQEAAAVAAVAAQQQQGISPLQSPLMQRAHRIAPPPPPPTMSSGGDDMGYTAHYQYNQHHRRFSMDDILDDNTVISHLVDQGYVSQSERSVIGLDINNRLLMDTQSSVTPTNTQITSPPTEKCDKKSILDDFVEQDLCGAGNNKEDTLEDNSEYGGDNVYDDNYHKRADFSDKSGADDNTFQITANMSMSDSGNVSSAHEISSSVSSPMNTQHDSGVSVVSSATIEDNSVDIIPERDTNTSDLTKHQIDHRRGIIETPGQLETVKNSTPLYGNPNWWGESGVKLVKDAERPRTIDLVERHTTFPASSHHLPGSSDHSPTVAGSVSSTRAVINAFDHTHTPPERDPGPTTTAVDSGNGTSASSSTDLGIAAGVFSAELNNLTKECNINKDADISNANNNIANSGDNNNAIYTSDARVISVDVNKLSSITTSTTTTTVSSSTPTVISSTSECNPVPSRDENSQQNQHLKQKQDLSSLESTTPVGSPKHEKQDIKVEKSPTSDQFSLPNMATTSTMSMTNVVIVGANNNNSYNSSSVTNYPQSIISSPSSTSSTSTLVAKDNNNQIKSNVTTPESNNNRIGIGNNDNNKMTSGGDDDDIVRPVKKNTSMAFTIDLGDDSPSSKPAPIQNNTAFTVDLGEDESGLSKSHGSGSLSKFLPQKLRKSFKDRATKAKVEKEAKQQQQQPSAGNESDNNPYSSPVSRRRRTAGQGTPKTGRRSMGYHSDGGNSAMSSDNEDISIRSDLLPRSSARKSLPPKPTPSTPRGGSSGGTTFTTTTAAPRTRHRPSTESTSARTARVLEAMSVEKKLEKRILRGAGGGTITTTTSTAKKSSAVASNAAGNSSDVLVYSSQASNARTEDYADELEYDDYEDEESYSSKRSGLAHNRNNVDGEPPSEYVLYKESKHYDTIIKSKSMQSMKLASGSGSGSNNNKTASKDQNKVQSVGEGSSNKKKARISTSNRTLAVPKIGDGEELPDDLSEAGTYTIEDEAVENARQSIDSIFNVPRKSDMRMIPRRPPPVQKQERVVEVVDTDINGNIEADEEEYFSEGEVKSEPIQPIFVGHEVKAAVYDKEEGSSTWQTKPHRQQMYDEDTPRMSVIEPGRPPSLESPHTVELTQSHQYHELSKSPNPRRSPSAISPASTGFSSSVTSASNTHQHRQRRKLPTPPVRPSPQNLESGGSNTSTPRTTPRTPRNNEQAVADQLDTSPGRHRGTRSYNDEDRGIGFTVSFDAPSSQQQQLSLDTPVSQDKSRFVGSEMVLPSSRDDNGHDDESLVSNMFSSASYTPVGIARIGGRQPREGFESTRSTGSIDTEVLLQDTEQVMRVLEQRGMNRRSLPPSGINHSSSISSHKRQDSLDDDYEMQNETYSPVPKEDLFLALDNDDSDSDDSTCAVVGNEESVNHSRVSSQVHSNQLVHKPEAKKVANTPNRHKPLSIKDNRNLSHIGGKSGKRLSSSSADFETFGGTDESGNESGSIASSISTDYSQSNLNSNSGANNQGSPKFQRQGSSGKGSIAHTRVNRTFALRRSKADGSDGETPRSDITAASSSTTVSTPRSARRSISDKATPRASSRTRPSSAKETSRTDVSLGQHIVQKSRDNVRSSKEGVNSKTLRSSSKDKSMNRKDGGRSSLRNTKSVSSSSDMSKPRSKPDVPTTPRSGKSGSGLSVSGTSASTQRSSASSQSAIGSKAKTEEFKAWQRRHKYDPRKAVADAKAKEKRARSVGNTPEFIDTPGSINNPVSVTTPNSTPRSRGDTLDSASSEDSATHLDEITRLSSMVASDLTMMTHQAKHETQEYTEVRTSAFTSVRTNHQSNGSAFSTPVKNNSNGMNSSNSPLDINSKTKEESSTQYDPVVLSSIQQLSLQLKSQASRILTKLGEIRGDDSGHLEDLHCDTVEEASPELTHALSNLRNTEHILRVLEKELFVDTEDTTEQELERIQHTEQAGFRPIPQPAATTSKSSTITKTQHSASKSSSTKTVGRKPVRMVQSQDSTYSHASTEYY